ncbi:hypothetical protein K440DRAFT_641199 [Wilcoxina mikolae CBS 423.85]|nr:hypothetical protein K440DRAFT_641199 [Wilcoxina mikolae CBS 423.85]
MNAKDVLLSDPRTYRSSTESSEVATDDFAALRESPGVSLEASEVATEYTIAIQLSPGAPLEASEVATEYTIAIQESPGVASRLPEEQGSALRLHSLVPEDSQNVCRVRHSKSTSATSGGFQGFRDQTIDFDDV